jgi:hypothetical protein
MKKDLRVHERRIPIGNVYAALGREYERVGKLIDFSSGGLAFDYMSDANPDLELSRINVFKVGEVFNLHNLPCKIVYDIPLPTLRDDIESLKRSHNRRCGVKFDKLPKEINFYLTLFLESHTKMGLNL